MPRLLKLGSCLSGLTCSLLLATSCAGGPLSQVFERSLEADPQLTENSPLANASTPSSDASTPATEPDAPAEATAPHTEAPQPGEPDFIGPVPPETVASETGQTAARSPRIRQSQPFSDLDQAPEELQPYLADLAQLGLIEAAPAESGNAANQFQPNQTITRRTYARWLFNANNQFYSDQTSKKIRRGVSSAQPAFQDVAVADPDFAAIQGLAEAGLIPSALTGNSTAVNFRPDAPLTREDLILWKVPLDTRQALPNASIEAVQEAWGFQDAAKIEPLALKATLADYQNGEFSNIRRAFGYTTLLLPQKAATRAEAAAVLWRFGNQTEGISAQELASGASATSSAPSTNSTPSDTPDAAN
ncbi:S-layer homology domain-containing protein [Almyronema epifaneia]|uniref:S-layer homology domain-containing protein n=1 Tax=Almyronema epifaneia S1 TaxID=2991925 RepID=A0ABW6IJ97_9CYAN